MKFVVLQDRVLAEKTASQTTETKSDFYIPDSVDKRYIEATIVGVGDPKDKFSVGDKIFLSKTSGFQFKYEGKEYIMAHINEVMAKIED